MLLKVSYTFSNLAKGSSVASPKTPSSIAAVAGKALLAAACWSAKVIGRTVPSRSVIEPAILLTNGFSTTDVPWA